MIEQKQIRELFNLLKSKLNKNFSNVENRKIAREKLGFQSVETYDDLPVDPNVGDVYMVRDASSQEDNLEEGEWAEYECTSIDPIIWIKKTDKYSTVTDFGTF